jgi:hypothetical protein
MPYSNSAAAAPPPGTAPCFCNDNHGNGYVAARREPASHMAPLGRPHARVQRLRPRSSA